MLKNVLDVCGDKQRVVDSTLVALFLHPMKAFFFLSNFTLVWVEGECTSTTTMFGFRLPLSDSA